MVSIRGYWLALLSFALFLRDTQSQQFQAPKFLSDEGKDLFNDIESDEHYFADAACESREKLLKHMAGQDGRDATEYRMRNLLHLGICEFRKANYAQARKRLESAVSEMQAPSEDALMKQLNTASIVLMKQAAVFLAKNELTQAGTQIRRCREVLDRNLRQTLKYIAKQMGDNAPPIEKMAEEIPGFGKSGQFLPQLMKQAPVLKVDLAWAEVVENGITELDKKLIDIGLVMKETKERLDVSKSSGKGGSLLYVKMLAMEPTVSSERLLVAEELQDKKFKKVFLDEASKVEKSTTLIKRTQEGSGCKEDKGMSKTCKALQDIADIQSNGFGESRLIVVKGGKTQQLDVCSTNANVGILMAAKDGAKVTIDGESTALEKGKALGVNFCKEVTLDAEEATPVLFAQAWHPEFAAVERTGEVRTRAKAFGLSEDESKAAVKVINDFAKKGWDKSLKAWLKESPMIANMKETLTEEANQKKKAEEEAAEAKRKEEEGNDETRKKNLAELEEKRRKKKADEEAAEEKRRQRKKQLEEERAKRDPWLNSPEVTKAEQEIEELKEARRDANAKLEFDLSTQLTKDISAAERALKKTIKKAKKAYKAEQGGGAKSDDKASGSAEDLDTLKKKLEEVKAAKKEASEAEDFAKAKKLKAEQADLEAKIKKKEEL